MSLRAAPEERPETPETEEQKKLRRLAKARPQKVILVDIKVPFGSWVGLLVTLALASIPASLLVALIVWMGIIAFGTFIDGLSTYLQ